MSDYLPAIIIFAAVGVVLIACTQTIIAALILTMFLAPPVSFIFGLCYNLGEFLLGRSPFM